MTKLYEIYADEAWTHGGQPLNRYWCFHGGIFGTQESLDRLDTSLLGVVKKHGVCGEVKWSNLNAGNYTCYVEWVDCLIDNIQNNDIKYRQLFLDRSYVWVPKHGEEPLREIDVQFKIYYQFLKHAFGIKYIPADEGGQGIKLFIRLDNHSSQKNKDQLVRFAEILPRTLARPDLSISVTFHNSSKARRLQICDLIMGAAGSYGNKMHKKRAPGKRGMTPKQKLRLSLCKHVYDSLRNLDADARGSKAFSWFETTGHEGALSNRYHHKMRIWKFIPKRHDRDEGWQNDNLDLQGNYQGPQIIRVQQSQN